MFRAQGLGRFDRISKAMQKVNGPTKDVGDELNSPVARVVEMAARLLAVQAASGAGNNTGAQLQIANMASGNAKRFVENLTNQRARQMLVDAIENPVLFRALLATPKAVHMNPELRSKLGLCFVGDLAGWDERDQ